MADLPVAHSPVGASGRYRWSKCPGSVALSAHIADETTEAAARGTILHGIAADFTLTPYDVDHLVGKTYEEDGHRVTLTQEDIDNVKVYISYLRDRAADGWDVILEQRFRLDHIDPEAFGTADAVLLKKVKHSVFDLEVVDYKSGYKFVDAAENEQLLYYGNGAIHTLRGLFGSKVKLREVYLTIVQPQQGEPRTFRLSQKDMDEDLAKLKREVEAVRNGDGKYKAGSWCDWCPARVVCPEFSKAIDTVPQGDPKTMLATMTDEQKAELLITRVPMVEAFIKALRSEAYRRGMDGRPLPGTKMVAKRANRSWADKEQVEEVIEEHDIKGHESVLLTPAKLETALGKAKFAELFGAFVKKQSSGYNCVPDTDKRQAAELDPTDGFEVIEDEK